MHEKQKHTVSNSLPSILVRYIDKKGLDTRPLYQCMNRDRSALADPETRLTAKQFDLLWHKAQEMAREQHFGLSFARELSMAWQGGNFIFNMMMNSLNVKAALERLVKYHDIVADAIRPVMDICSTHVRISWKYFGPADQIPDQLGQALMALYTIMLRRLTENQMVLSSACFTSLAPDNLYPYNKIFNAPLYFNKPENELLIEKACLNLPILLADDNVRTALEQLAQERMTTLFAENTLPQKVSTLIGKLFLDGKKASLTHVAKDLAMSPRNLQLKLKKDGTSYQEILDNLRKKIALDHLQDPDAYMSDLAFLLGYSDQSAFNHAFKRWTGKTPGQYLYG